MIKASDVTKKSQSSSPNNVPDRRRRDSCRLYNVISTNPASGRFSGRVHQPVTLAHEESKPSGSCSLDSGENDQKQPQQQPFNGPLTLSGTTRVSRYEKKHSSTHVGRLLGDTCHFLGLMVQGEDNRGRHTNSPAAGTPLHPDNRCPHLHHHHHLTPDAPLAATLPIYSGLGQAPRVIPGGLVRAIRNI